MNAAVTGLHAQGGRQRALVQRPRRKMHVASIGPGEVAWTTICDRLVAADGAGFAMADAPEIGEEHAEQLCADCYRLVLLATLLVAQGDLPAIRLRVAR